MPSVNTDGITILYCSSPPPATIKKEETISDFLYGRTPYRNF